MVSFYGLIIWCDTEALDFETCTPHTHTHTHTQFENLYQLETVTLAVPRPGRLCVCVWMSVCAWVPLFSQCSPWRLSAAALPCLASPPTNLYI